MSFVLKYCVVVAGAFAWAGCTYVDSFLGKSDVVDVEDARSMVQITSIFEEDIGYPDRAELAWSHLKSKLAEYTRKSNSVLLGEKVQLDPKLIEKAIYYCIHHGLFIQADYLIGDLRGRSDKSAMSALQAEAYLAETQKQPSIAIELLEDLIELDPQHQGARVNLGRLYTEYGHFDQAIEMLHPLREDPYVANLMLVGFRHLGLNEQADIICAQKINQYKSYEMKYNCGLHHFQAYRDASKAIGFIEDAISEMPEENGIYANASILLEEIKGFQQIHN